MTTPYPPPLPPEEFKTNDLTRKGCLYVNPIFLVKFRGVLYGTWSLEIGHLYDALAWQSDVTIGQIKEWYIEHGDETFHVQRRGVEGAERTCTLRELHQLMYPEPKAGA